MSDWTSGYVADIGYTFGYYQELNPLRIRMAFLNAGLSFPHVGAACELGFGQGVSSNFHAAASVTQWHGTDFNPSQAAFAQELATVSDSGAKLYDDAFADLAKRADLPDFDYIGIHGIWSWISDENRAVMVDFIKRKLRVGGVLYISYNTLPGWAAFAPMRHLMTEHAEVMGAEGRGIVNRIDGAIEFAEKLIATNPAYARANPQIAERIGRLKGQNRHYLAHEYFNRDWHPMHFATMAEWLEPAKLQFACSAHYLDHIQTLNLSAEQQAFLKEIPDPMFRESVRDFMTNSQFRKDYWVKGVRKLAPMEQVEAIREQKFVLVSQRTENSLKVNGNLGEATLNADIYNPILDLMGDRQARTIGTIEQTLTGQGISLGQITQAVMVLAGTGQMSAVQQDEEIAAVKARTDKLNGYLMKKACSSAEISYLVSPVSGGGVAVGRFEQIMLLAMRNGKTEPAECARYVWDILSAQGQRLLKEGKTLETAEENLAELTRQTTVFVEKGLPILEALQIA